MTKEESIMYLYKAYVTKKRSSSAKLNSDAIKKGILIDNKCKRETVDLAIKVWGIDGYLLNQTFHKSLDKVINTDMEELIIEQIMHYMTTYGLEALGIYDKDTVYLPKEKLELPELKEDIKFINILPITEEELKERLWDLITSKIPLSSKTVNCIICLSDYLKIDNDNIDMVTNKEVKVALYDKLNILPKNNIEFLRYLIYKLTNQTLLIKDKRTMNKLNESNKALTLSMIKNYQKVNSLVPLSEIFNRFKPLFLALKTSNASYYNDKNEKIISKNDTLTKDQKDLNKIINKISKLSKRYHKPFKMNNLDNFIIWYKDNYKKDNYIELLNSKLEHESIWRIIKLRNYIHLINSNIISRVYKIRNRKVWITTKDQKIRINKETINVLDKIIIDKLKPNVLGKKIYIDKNVHLMFPESEKKFVGNIPFSSSIDLEKDNLLVGIHWFNIQEERVDLDLKVIANDYSIGWDCEYKVGDELVFTGDMTDAPYPLGASEYIYIDKKVKNGIFSLKVNNYTCDIDNIEYDIIIARKNKDELQENYIVNPNDIIVKIPKNTIELGQSEHSLGNIIIEDNKIKLVFLDLSTSNRRSSSNSEMEEILRKYLVNENNVKCKLQDYLKKAGAIIVNSNSDVDIDLSINNLNKDSIIKLFK